MASRSMHAAVLHGPHDLRYEEVAQPEPAEDEVLIEIVTNGLCGSDIHFFKEGKLGPFVVSEPYIPGHEAVGYVRTPNRRGPRREAGQLVAIEPGIPCRRCEHCKSGRYNLCEDVVFMSAPPVNGTFAEYATVAADFAHPVPEGLSHEVGALAEPVSVGVQACNRAGITAGQSIAVVGAGPIGLITCMVARAFGATRAYLIDVQRNRLETGRTIGATGVIDASKEDPASALLKLTGGRGVDVVFDTSGSSTANAGTPFLARRGGVVTVVGWPETATVDYPIEVVIEKELDVRGVNRYCNTYPQALELLAVGALDVDTLITHRYPFSDVVNAFSFAASHPAETVKVLISSEYE